MINLLISDFILQNVFKVQIKSKILQIVYNKLIIKFEEFSLNTIQQNLTFSFCKSAKINMDKYK